MVPLEQLDGIKDIMGEEANVQYMFIVCANVKLANGEGDLERYVECSHPSLLQAIGATRHDTGRVVLTHSLTQTLYSVTKPEVEMSVGGSRYVCVCVCVRVCICSQLCGSTCNYLWVPCTIQLDVFRANFTIILDCSMKALLEAKPVTKSDYISNLHHLIRAAVKQYLKGKDMRMAAVMLSWVLYDCCTHLCPLLAVCRDPGKPFEAWQKSEQGKPAEQQRQKPAWWPSEYGFGSKFLNKANVSELQKIRQCIASWAAQASITEPQVRMRPRT